MAWDAERLTRFFAGSPDDQERTYDAILAWDDERLERVHDYIQWMFPLPEQSGANPGAPILDQEAIETIRGDAGMQARLRAGYLRMLAFYGFELHGDEVVEGPGFANAASNWLRPSNHNHLRLTRILRSLRVLGLGQEAAQLWRALRELYERDRSAGKRRITEQTYGFWKQAAK